MDRDHERGDGAITNSTNTDARALIAHYAMRTMETENVQYTQAYTAPTCDAAGRSRSTAIVALLTDAPDSFSDMHRLDADEVWHFYLGDPIELLLCNPDGSDELRLMGPDVLEGQHVQTVVPAGVWMGARLRPGGRWGLYGNTMAPGFTLAGFEAADAEALCARYPHRGDLIRAMTRASA